MELKDCQALCENKHRCQGITAKAYAGKILCTPLSGVGAKKGNPGPLDLSQCKQNQAGFDTFVYMPRKNDSFAFDAIETDSSSTEPTRRTMSPSDIVNAANALYNREDDGVLVHLGNWKGTNTSKNNIMSWSAVNKFSVNGGSISMYLGGRRGGVIADPAVVKSKKLVSCSFPCDGSTHERYYSGCGKLREPQCDSCNGPDQNYDWCNGNLHGVPMWSCGFRPNETADMLQAFRGVKNGTSPLLPGHSTWRNCNKDPGGNACCSPCACWAYSKDEHNEVIIVPQDWDSALPDALWAFVLPDPCLHDANCKRVADEYYAECQEEFKDKCPPRVGMNLNDLKNPFHVISTASSGIDIVL